MNNKNKRLAILSNIEEFAFYGLPDFDQAQRHKYFKKFSLHNISQHDINFILTRYFQDHDLSVFSLTTPHF